MTELQQLLQISCDRLDAINKVLLDPDTKIIRAFLDVVKKYGTPEEINQKAREARSLDNLLAKTKEKKPEYIKDLEWLQEQTKVDNLSPLRITGERSWARLAGSISSQTTLQ